MATLYLPTDDNAPVLTYSTTNNLTRFSSTKLLLKACLVNGYGSKQAAGWTLIDEGDLFIVLRNASGNYVTFVANNAYSGGGHYSEMRLYLHATYTGMASNVPQGIGVVTGAAAGNTAPHQWGHQYLWYSGVTSKWMIVADGRTFLLTTATPGSTSITAFTGGSLDSANSTANTRGLAALYVGDDLGGNFIAVGGFAGASYSDMPLFNGTTITTLYNPTTGLLVDGSGVAVNLQSLKRLIVTSTQFAQVGAVTINQLELSSVRWVCDGVQQPGLRGLRQDTMLSLMLTTTAKNCIEGTNIAHNYSNILVPKVMEDGYIYQPLLAALTDRGQAIITNNPAYW